MCSRNHSSLKLHRPSSFAPNNPLLFLSLAQSEPRLIFKDERNHQNFNINYRKLKRAYPGILLQEFETKILVDKRSYKYNRGCLSVEHGFL